MDIRHLPPLPRGFRLRLLEPDNWYSGDQGMPDTATAQWLETKAPRIGRTAQGRVALSLERLAGAGEIAEIIARARSTSAAPASDRAAHEYLDFMIQNAAPKGLIKASFHIDSVECGGSNVEPHIALELPSPELRVTLLKNTSIYPIKIQEILMSIRNGGAIWPMDQNLGKRTARSEFDILEPGQG
jgi:hypothetical protein